MTTELNQQWRLARTPPGGWPVPDDFSWHEGALPEVGVDQCLTETVYLSMDPYQWGRRRSGVESPGDVCHGRTVSRVLASRHPSYGEGDFIFNTNGWQRYGLTGAGISDFGYMLPRRLDAAVAPVSTAIGVLGMLGLTAYAGMIVQCAPRPGETVVVSAASGGVGQVAGQLARIAGARVVGVAGGPEKCAYVTDELGFDACVSRKAPDFAAQLAAACPDGVNVYFENVGGAVYEAVLGLLAPGARITVCGFISQYGNTDGGNAREAWQQTGQAVFDRHGVTVHDLFVGNYVQSHQDEFLATMAGYLQDKLVHYREDRRAGLEQAPRTFIEMLGGGNFGKTIVTVAPELAND